MNQDSERYEVKLTVDAKYRHEIDMWLRLSFALFKEAFPPRWVNSLYFDTFENHAFNANLAGVSQRQKLRYRWYGRQPQPGPGTLELKCRENTIGWKLNFPVDRVDPACLDHWQHFKDFLEKKIPDKGKFFLHQFPVPVMIIRYYRNYLLSKCGRIRITVDDPQEFYWQHHMGKPNFHLDYQIHQKSRIIFTLC